MADDTVDDTVADIPTEVLSDKDEAIDEEEKDTPPHSGIATLQAYIAAINASQYDTAYSMLAQRSKNLTSDIARYEETEITREHITMDIIEEYVTEDAEHRYSHITARLTVFDTDETNLEHIIRYSLRQDIMTEQRVMHAKN